MSRTDHPHDKRRDAINAVRLSWLGRHGDVAARTFNLQHSDVTAARDLLSQWAPYADPGTPEGTQVAYLLAAGWKPQAVTRRRKSR
ncbi:MAG TPA: hypothetical protein VMB75_10130 [Rhodocyclaceae bacterium]|nr:hypothetical protein [Rhodocyclaceae bacterium]